MASCSIGDSADDLDSKGRVRWTETSKVYTRRIRQKAQKVIDYNGSAEPRNSVSPTITTPTLAEVFSAPSADHKNSAASPWCNAGASPVVSSQLDECRDGVQESVEAVVAADNVISSKLKMQEDGVCPTAELKNHENSTHPSSKTIHDLKTSSPHYNDELPQTNENGAVQLRETLSLSNEIDLQTCRSVETPQPPATSVEQDDLELVPVSTPVPIGNGPNDNNGASNQLVIFNVDDKVKFRISNATPMNEIQELRKRLEWELNQVRRLVKQLEAKEIKLSSSKPQMIIKNVGNDSNFLGSEVVNVGEYYNSQHQHSLKDVAERRVMLKINSGVNRMQNPVIRPMGLARVNSDLGAIRNLEVKPYSRQLSIAVMENNQRAGELVEKEKRTPKANQYYRKSEFLLAKDRLPPESNKKPKTNKRKKHRAETEYAFGFGFGLNKSRNRLFKSCSSILQRLMKHNHGWVFNEPVNAKALGLHDYHDIITHPMDLGTIKTRLSQKWYRSPRDFAEDVRLVFRNALIYNPKGQDVHFMAEELSQIFEERWAVLENEYNPYWNYQLYLDASLPAPTYRDTLPQFHYAPFAAPAPAHTMETTNFPATVAISTPLYASNSLKARKLDRPELISESVAIDSVMERPHISRTPAPKKPKAKDLNKRDMTNSEKQRLGTNLQGLPSEKLDAIVQIIKRSNTALSHRDDEIEVDIDRVDTETLWELDRFVTNYKKNLSKIKRKAELALQARMLGAQGVEQMNTTTESTGVQIAHKAGFDKSVEPHTAEGEKQEHFRSRSSSSSSSSSDSGSSSSDSDSDSSSSDGSDDGNSPKT